MRRVVTFSNDTYVSFFTYLLAYLLTYLLFNYLLARYGAAGMSCAS